MDERFVPARVEITGAGVTGNPIYPTLVQFPAVCLMGTLATDIAYWRTADMMWANFSAWLLTAGLVIGALAVIVGFLSLLFSGRVRGSRHAWLHWLGLVVTLVIGTFNAFVHSRDAYTSVVPDGLILSAVTVVALLLTALIGGSLVYRYPVRVVNP